MKKILYIILLIAASLIFYPKNVLATPGAPCTTDSQCSDTPNNYCIFGFGICAPIQPGTTCLSNADCTSPDTCNTTKRQCEGGQISGLTDEQCNDQIPCSLPDQICVESRCVSGDSGPCFEDSDCAPGLTCSGEGASSAKKCLPLAGYETPPKFIAPILQIPIPTLKPFTKEDVRLEGPVGNQYIVVPFIARYIVALYKYGVSIAFIISIVMIMIAGFRWMTAGGNSSTIGQAKKTIGTTIIGLILLLGSYLILNTINPDLIKSGVLRVRYISPLLLSLREGDIESGDSAAGGADAPDALTGGKGSIDSADRTRCPNLDPGTKFTGAFTTYYTISAGDYGKPGSFSGIYNGTDQSLKSGLGDFFCAVAMECYCPNGKKSAEGEVCVNSKGRRWRPCAYFLEGTRYCESQTGRFKHVAGQTVAASTCFPRPCTLKVGDRILQVTDRGSGIIGTHFDLYVGTKGESDFVHDTSWLSTDIEVVDCPGEIGENELSRMRKAYARYKPGVCSPGANC